MRLSSGCAPRAASTKARTQSQTWNCCENVLVTWHPKNMIKDLNLNKFLWFFEGGFRSLNFRHQAPSNFAAKGGTCAGVPNQCGKAAAWSLDTFRVGGSKGLKGRSIFPRLVAMKLQFPTYCLFCWGISPELIWILIEWLFDCRICRGAVSVYSAEAPLPGSECQWHEGID